MCSDRLLPWSCYILEFVLTAIQQAKKVTADLENTTSSFGLGVHAVPSNANWRGRNGKKEKPTAAGNSFFLNLQAYGTLKDFTSWRNIITAYYTGVLCKWKYLFLCIKWLFTHFVTYLYSYENKPTAFIVRFFLFIFFSSFKRTSSACSHMYYFKFSQGRQSLPGELAWLYLNSGRVGNCFHYCLFLLSFSETEKLIHL